MTIELEKKELTIISKLQDDNAQNIIEGDIIVSDTKPDVISIINVDGEVRIKSKENHKDMIVIRGAVDFNILYQSDDPSRAICNINHSINFDQTIDIQTDEQNIKSVIDYKIEHLDSSIINGRKINVKAILNCYAKVTKEYDISAISNIVDDDVQLLTKTITVTKDVRSEDVGAFINWEADVPIGKPAVREILRSDAALIDKDIKATGNKIIVKGNIEVKSLYTPDMNECVVDFITNEIPFSEVLDVDNISDENEVDVKIEIENIITGLKTDQDGDQRIIDYEFELNYIPSYTQKKLYEVIEDAYSVSSRLEFERKPIKLNRTVESTKTQSSIKDMLKLSNEDDLFDKIYDIKSKINLTGIDTGKNKVIIDGIIDVNLIYITTNEQEPVKSLIRQIPFHQTLELNGVDSNMEVLVEPSLKKFTYDLLNNREVELRNVLMFNIKVNEEQEYKIINSIDEVELDDNFKTLQPSMTVYYVQDGDSLWSIAKKYFTTTNELEKINNIENSESLKAGLQLLIPKMI